MKLRHKQISIHALLAESDQKAMNMPRNTVHFYPRSPCGERPLMLCPLRHQQHFYPRSPCGERPKSKEAQTKNLNFYPRSPCGERLHYDNYNLHCVEISIHALLAESDLILAMARLMELLFLSTLSLRRATRFQFVC